MDINTIIEYIAKNHYSPNVNQLKTMMAEANIDNTVAQAIIEYVAHTPTNTNVNHLYGLLNQGINTDVEILLDSLRIGASGVKTKEFPYLPSITLDGEPIFKIHFVNRSVSHELDTIFTPTEISTVGDWTGYWIGPDDTLCGLSVGFIPPEEEGLGFSLILYSPQTAQFDGDISIIYPEEVYEEYRENILLGIDIQPPLTLTPAFSSFIPFKYDPSETEIQFIASATSLTPMAEYTITVAPGPDYYAGSTETSGFGEKGEAIQFTKTADTGLDFSIHIKDIPDYEEISEKGLDVVVQISSVSPN